MRYPFLDDKLVKYLKSIERNILTDFYQEKGKGGEKWLLR